MTDDWWLMTDADADADVDADADADADVKQMRTGTTSFYFWSIFCNWKGTFSYKKESIGKVCCI